MQSVNENVQAILSESGLDWKVETAPLSAMIEDPTNPDSLIRKTIDTHKMTLRSDTKAQLGVVGAKWEPIHNHQLAELANALSESGDVKFTGAFEIAGGKRVLFELESSSVIDLGGDIVNPITYIGTGHDGTMSVSMIATTRRLVCMNELHAIMRGFKSQGTAGVIRLQHKANVLDKLDDARRLLQCSIAGHRQFADQANALVGTKMNEQAMREFFLEVYAKTWGEIPANPETKSETRKRKSAEGVVAQWVEAVSTGPGAQLDSSRGTAWGALNALTYWSDHVRSVNGDDETEARKSQKIFGAGSRFKKTAFESALSLV